MISIVTDQPPPTFPPPTLKLQLVLNTKTGYPNIWEKLSTKDTEWFLCICEIVTQIVVARELEPVLVLKLLAKLRIEWNPVYNTVKPEITVSILTQ